MRFYGLLILLVRPLAKNLANATFSRSQKLHKAITLCNIFSNHNHVYLLVLNSQGHLSCEKFSRHFMQVIKIHVGGLYNINCLRPFSYYSEFLI